MRTRLLTGVKPPGGGGGERGWKGAGLCPLALRAINQNKLKSGSLSTYGALSNRTVLDLQQRFVRPPKSLQVEGVQ